MALLPLGQQQGPGNIETFAIVYEVIRKFVHILLVDRFFGAQNDLGMSCVLIAFTDDAVAVARTAIEDTPESTQDTYRLHDCFSRCCLPTFHPEQLQFGGSCVHILSGLTILLTAGQRLFACTICCVQFLC